MPGVVAKAKAGKSKNAYRRQKKKEKRHETPSEADTSARENETPAPSDVETDNEVAVRDGDVDVEIVTDYDVEDPLYEQYREVLSKFTQPTEEEAAAEEQQPEILYSDDEVQDEEEEEETAKKLSKKQRKKQNQMSIAELKASVRRPELVEWTDVNSSDPKLLLAIKSCKNVVPVPSHWSLKREYLSSKRGIEKPAFALPKFIQETGIAEMRDAVLEKQAEMSLKQKQRERVQGKLGKLDIDYNKLYDAFYRRQTKPELTRYGEVYYEGKEYETNLRHLRPGEISDELKEALNMVPGGPPPWLINQQRFGLPPSYPNMKIPGVNAPIPPGASWGYSPGQYGRPPTDDAGRPLFGGDLSGFAELQQQQLPVHPGEPVERGVWGALRAEGESDDEEEDDEEEEEEEEEEGEGAPDMTGTYTSMTGVNSAMPSEIGGTESIGGEFTLRKQRKGIETEEPRGGAARSLYQVIPEKDVEATGFFGGEHAYDLDAARRDQIGERSRKRKADDVEISVDVDALGDNDRLDKEALKKQYDAQKKAEQFGQWAPIDQDDLSEMIAAESRKQAKREEKRPRR
ncbi:DUF382-domain-containing protein [Sporormia fimetaria CBS 119925]|uniref:DUF382-domain-containing protein n=1 Tax=Sporormia fimetaria CBS 119925 TaxID=1340428 RepID=A0A6A6V0R9_9PLEO|nr:DUF382-domain-containing protein [Sporormia fimetaria CBS 119925]